MPLTTTVPGAVFLDGSVSRTLRAATRAEHLASEAALDLASLATPAALVALLRGWGSVWEGVAQAASGPAACATARAELLGPAALALDWLAADLGDLAVVAGPGDEGRGLTGSTGSTDTRAADRAGEGFSELLASTSSSWGVAYVLRGSRLGGATLAPHLSEAVGLPYAVGTTFLRSARTDPGREWVAFRRRLDSLDLTPQQVGVAVDAARWTFERVGAELAAVAPGHHGAV